MTIADALFYPSLRPPAMVTQANASDVLGLLIGMLSIDPTQAKLRTRSILGAGCLEMTEFCRGQSFDGAAARSICVLYSVVLSLIKGGKENEGKGPVGNGCSDSPVSLTGSHIS